MTSVTVKAMAALGIGIALFAVSLVVIHVSLRTIGIIFGIGSVLVIAYLYIDYRQNRPVPLKAMCKCTTCDHRDERTCEEQHCPCCTIEKDGRYEHGVSTLS